MGRFNIFQINWKEDLTFAFLDFNKEKILNGLNISKNRGNEFYLEIKIQNFACSFIFLFRIKFQNRQKVNKLKTKNYTNNTKPKRIKTFNSLNETNMLNFFIDRLEKEISRIRGINQ